MILVASRPHSGGSALLPKPRGNHLHTSRMLSVLFACCSLLVASCTFTTKGVPSNLAAYESAMKSQRVPWESSYSAFVNHLPGLTVTGSATHLPGSLTSPTPVMTMVDVPAAQFGPQLSIEQAPACAITADEASASQALIDELFASINPTYDVKAITIHTVFVPEQEGVAKKVFAIRTGNKVDVRFYFHCSSSPERDLYLALLRSTHEVTHLLLHLEHRDVGALADDIKNEQVADGAPACLFQLRPTTVAEARLKAAIALNDYFGKSWELKNHQDDPSIWCDAWRASVGSQAKTATGR